MKVFQSSFILISRSPFRTEPKPKQTRRCRTNKHFDVAETGAENKQDTFQQNVDDHQPSHNHTDRVKLVESLLELGVLKLHHRGHDDRQLLDQLRVTTVGAPPLMATTGNYWRCPAPRFCETAHLTGAAGASEAAFGRALAILLSEIAYLAQMEKVRKCTSGKEFSSQPQHMLLQIQWHFDSLSNISWRQERITYKLKFII